MSKRSPGPAKVISRRRLFQGSAGLLAGAAFAGGMLAAAPALAKAAKKDVGYQPTPKGAARCDKCTYFQQPAACKVVSGPISPAGWCSLYGPKA